MVRTDDPEVVWDKPNDVDDKWISFIDHNVFTSRLQSYFTLDMHINVEKPSELPPGSKPLSINRCGNSYWTKGAEIRTEQGDGSIRSFFLKVSTLL